MTRNKEWFGLYSPDEQSVKRTLEDLVSQTSLLMVPHAFPPISAYRYEHTWQQPWGVSGSQWHPCICRVVGHQCWRRTKPLAQGRPPGYDHPALWLGQGPLICALTPPYPLETADLQAMRAFAVAHDLTRNIWGYGAWHSPGQALRVEWWHTSLRAALLNRSVQTPSLAYEKKVTQRHRIIHLSSVAGVAVPSAPVIARAASAPPRLHHVGMVGVADVGCPGGRQTRLESARELVQSDLETQLIIEGYLCQQGTHHSLAARETHNDHSLKETDDIWTPICTTASWPACLSVPPSRALPTTARR
jgi:hypothetical protein